MASFLLANPLFGMRGDGKGFYFFTLDIRFYAVFIVCGMLLAAFLSGLMMKRRNMSPDLVFTLFVFCIPSALICARLYYCITAPVPFVDWWRVHDGGLSIIGGVMGGVLAGFIVCKVCKIEFFRAADCVVITILIAQAIGRLGNFVNQEVYGAVVTNPALQWAPFAVYIEADGQWHYAFCFYEMFINAIGFGLLYSAAWFWNKKPNGVFTFAYFVWYGTVRTIMEPLRDPSYILNGGGVPWSLITSILFIVFGLAGIGVLLSLNYKKEGALFGSKTGDPCGITKFLSPEKGEVPYFSKINMMGANYPPAPPKKKKGKAQAESVESETQANEPETQTDVNEANSQGSEEK